MANITAPTRRTRVRRSSSPMVSEFLVTFIAVFGGLWVFVSTGPQQPWGRAFIAIGFGIFTALALLAGRPDSHGNTLGSIAAWAAKLFGSGTKDLGMKFVIQMLAAWLAVFLVWLAFRRQATEARYGAAIPTLDVGWWSTFWNAFWIALAFCLFFLFVADRVSNKIARAALLGTAFGFAVYASIPKSGGGLNTARELAPASVIGDAVWSAVLGGIIAALVAGFLYRFFVVNRAPLGR